MTKKSIKYLKKCKICGKSFKTNREKQILCSHVCHKKRAKKRATLVDSKKWIKLKEYCLERDNYTCQECGSIENLHCHHIMSIYEEGDNSVDNLIILCAKCHYKKH